MTGIALIWSTVVDQRRLRSDNHCNHTTAVLNNYACIGQPQRENEAGVPHPGNDHIFFF